MSEQQRLSPGTESPRTDWSDIGSICRTFGNEREAVTAIFSGRMTPGRNFWKDAADEIDRLRGVAQAPRTPLDLSAGELSTLATDAFREAAQASSWGAFKRPGAMVFLDGRNEHGSHVLPSLPTNMPPEYESDLPEYAEEIIAAAEALGFAVLDHVWAEWRYNEPEYGDEGRIAIPGYWEFVGINAEVTRALSAVTPSPVAVDRYAVDDPWCRPVGKTWTPDQFWEYVGGLVGEFEAGQIRDMLASKGLSLSSTEGK